MLGAHVCYTFDFFDFPVPWEFLSIYIILLVIITYKRISDHMQKYGQII